MEKTLDLKMSDAIVLGKEELKELNGGFLPVQWTIIAIEIAVAVDEFVEGVKKGWEENKR